MFEFSIALKLHKRDFVKNGSNDFDETLDIDEEYL